MTNILLDYLKKLRNLLTLLNLCSYFLRYSDHKLQNMKYVQNRIFFLTENRLKTIFSLNLQNGTQAIFEIDRYPMLANQNVLKVFKFHCIFLSKNSVIPQTVYNTLNYICLKFKLRLTLSIFQNKALLVVRIERCYDRQIFSDRFATFP